MCLTISDWGAGSEIANFYDYHFIMTFAISVVSCAFGITNFLKAGPCKFLPSGSGKLDGYVSIGTPLVMLIAIGALVGKGLLLPVIADEGAAGLSFLKVSIWMGLNIIPQITYVSVLSAGFK